MTDKTIIRLVVGFLGVTALATVAGGFAITFVDKAIPALIAIGSSAVGAVAALLARTSTGGDAPTTDSGSVPTSLGLGISDDGHTLSDAELAAIGAGEDEGAP